MANPLDSNRDIPEPWKSEMEPLNKISQEKMNQIVEPITIEELWSTIKDLPNKKASGPNGIPYELFKHIGPKAEMALLQLLNHILYTGIPPLE